MEPAWLTDARAAGMVTSEVAINTAAFEQPAKPSRVVEPGASVGVVHVLWLPGYTPHSLNETVGHHWSKKAKSKKADRQIVAHYAKCQGLPIAQTPRRVGLRIILAKGQRAMDVDNIKKGLLDALVHAGLLVNDSPKWCFEGPIEYLRHAGELRETFVLLTDC